MAELFEWSATVLIDHRDGRKRSIGKKQSFKNFPAGNLNVDWQPMMFGLLPQTAIEVVEFKAPASISAPDLSTQQLTAKFGVGGLS